MLNAAVPTHLICSDKKIFRDFLQNRKMIPFISLALAKSFMDYTEDLPLNLHV